MATHLPPSGPLAMIKASSLGHSRNHTYATRWKGWTRWCEQEGVDPLHATTEQVIQHLTANAHRSFGSLSDICGSISWVYRNAGKDSPTHDPRVPAAMRQLAGLPPVHVPTDQLSPSRTQEHETQLGKFRAWCHSKDKCDLPAHPEDIAEFLRETAGVCSIASLSKASAAIGRHHRDHGHPNTPRYPEVRAAVADIKTQHKLRQSTLAVHELAPGTIQGMEIIKASNLMATTKNNYTGIWKRWAQWCHQEDIDPLNSTPEHVIQYLTANRERGSQSLGKEWCSVIFHVYRNSGKEPPTTDHRVLAAKRELAGKPPVATPTDQMNPQVAQKHRNRLKKFKNWCKRHKRQHLPASPETIAEYLREMYEFYVMQTVRETSAAIAREHRDRGQPDTSRYPQVLAVLADLRRQDELRERTHSIPSLSPTSSRNRKYLENHWRRWCSEEKIDPMEATAAHVVAYLRAMTACDTADHIRRRARAMSVMYEGGPDPTNTNEVKTLLADLKTQPSTPTERQPKRNRIPLDQMPDILAAVPTPLPPGLTEAHAERMRENAVAAQLAPNTRELYLRKGWHPYTSWCDEIGISTQDATPEHVRAFISTLAEIHKPSYVGGALVAIRYFYDHERPDDNPARAPSVFKEMRGIERKNPGAPAQMDPIRQADFERIAKVAQMQQPWDKPHTAILRGAVDIAFLALMRDCLLRIGETANARWSHLKRESDGTGRLTIPKSKTDQTGKGYILFVSVKTLEALDAMSAIKDTLEIDTKTDDRIFQLSKSSIYNRIRSVCELAGLKGRYGGHSARIGMAQDLMAAGVSLGALMVAGRWKSTKMAARYTQNVAAGQGAVAQWYDRDPERGQIKTNPLGSYGLIPQYTRAGFGS